MKNTVIKLVCLKILLSLSYTGQGQYITLKEKQFYDQQGAPFYPVICNYWVHLNTNYANDDTSPLRISNGYCTTCTVSHFELQPENRNGSTNGFEASFTNGDELIRADLTKMLEMGFNTVRVFGLMWELHDHFDCTSPYIDDRFNLGGRYICKNYSNPTGINHDQWWGEPLKSKPPYTTDPVLQDIIIPKINQFLDIANEVGIKVILLTGGGALSESLGMVSNGATNPNNTTDCMTYSGAKAEQVEDFKQYHEALADALKSRTEILAYDLYNEQGFGSSKTVKDDQGVEYYLPRIDTKKDKICENTSIWYDAIKAKDPNHLITIANTDIRDVYNFDAAVMKLDFNSYHIYPNWETRAFENYNKTLALERLKTEFYWINNNSPYPWILGETGAPAWTAAGQDAIGQNTDSTLPTYTTNHVGENISTLPIVWGNFDDQTAFAQESQAMVINYGGNGYAWWAFQDAVEPSGFSIVDNDPGYHWSNLLKSGDPTWVSNHYEYGASVSATLERPMVNSAFSSNTIYHKTGNADMPTNYYNAWGGQYYTIQGYVYDKNNQPIQDAVVHGSNRWVHRPKPIDEISDVEMQFNEEFGFDVHTFTNADGYYELKAPVTGSVPDEVYDYTKFDFIRVSAPGAGVAQWHPTDPANGPNYTYSNQVLWFNIDQMQGIFDKNAYNVTINNGENETYTARHKLTTQDLLVEAGGVGDFYAGMEVEVKPGFEAKQGSEVFLHTAMVKPDCNLSPSYKTDETHRMKKSITRDRQIDARYRVPLPEHSFVLSPNPAQHQVTIFSSIPVAGTVSVYYTDGSLAVAAIPLTGSNTTVDISQLSAGCYEVRITSEAENKTFKLITLKN